MSNKEDFTKRKPFKQFDSFKDTKHDFKSGNFIIRVETRSTGHAETVTTEGTATILAPPKAKRSVLSVADEVRAEADDLLGLTDPPGEPKEIWTGTIAEFIELGNLALYAASHAGLK